MGRVSTKAKIVWSRTYALMVMGALFISGVMVGWMLYKKTNAYLGYTNGVEFFELTMAFMIEFFDDFDTGQLKIALLSAIGSFILGLIKIFRTGKKSR